MSDMDIVEIEDENQFHCNINENHKLRSSSPGKFFGILVTTFFYYNINY